MHDKKMKPQKRHNKTWKKLANKKLWLWIIVGTGVGIAAFNLWGLLIGPIIGGYAGWQSK